MSDARELPTLADRIMKMSDPTAIRETDDWAMRTARITLKRKREAENTGMGFTLANFADVLRERLKMDPPATPRRTKRPVATEPSKLHAAAIIYDAYPRKEARAAAIAAILKAMDKCTEACAEPPEVFLLGKTKLFANAVSRWSELDRRFIPHPATWFNQERYCDSPHMWERVIPNAAHAIRVELANETEKP